VVSASLLSPERERGRVTALVFPMSLDGGPEDRCPKRQAAMNSFHLRTM
jgi:hypothetical protein